MLSSPGAECFLYYFRIPLRFPGVTGDISKSSIMSGEGIAELSQEGGVVRLGFLKKSWKNEPGPQILKRWALI